MFNTFISSDGIAWTMIDPISALDHTDRAACVTYAEAVTVATGAAWAEVRRIDGFVLATWGPSGDTVRQDW